MRFFTTLLVAGTVAIASAQSTTVTPTTSTTSVDPAQTSQSEVIKCLNACTPGDVACTSKCIAVPNPDASQVNATNQCIAACPQGNGTASDILNYQNCEQGCIGKYYFTSGGTPQATGTGSGSSPSGTGSVTTGTGTAATGSAASSASNAASTSTSKAAGDVVHVAGSAAGLLGLLAALLTL